MLSGKYFVSMDERGRVRLPAKFRNDEVLANINNIKLTAGYDNCVYAFTPGNWEKFLLKQSENQKSEEEKRAIMRLLTADSKDSNIDRQGRMPVPQELRDLLGLGREIYIIGVLDHFELWDKASWEAYYRNTRNLLGSNGAS